MKKILCTLLVLAMVVSCISVVSFAKLETTPEAETIWTMDFEDATAVGYAPNSQTGTVTNAGVIDSGDTHGKVYSWTAANSYSSKGWTLTPYIQAFAAKNPDKNIVLTVTAEAKVGDDVVAEDATKSTARFGFRSPVDTNNDANVGFDTTPYVKGFGTWTTLTGTKTVKASEIEGLTNNHYRLFFDVIQGTDEKAEPKKTIGLYFDNITVTAQVAPDATKVTFTAESNSIATATGAVTKEVDAFVEANGTTGTFKKTYRVYSTATASKTIQLQFQATVNKAWVGGASTTVTKTVAPYTWTEFEVSLPLVDGEFVTTNGATAYSNAFLRITANSAEVGASLYVVDVTNPDWAVTGSQYNSGKATFTRAYSSGVPSPEAVEFTAVPAGTANRTYYARNGAIGTEVKNLVASDFTGKKTFTFKVYNTGTVELPAVFVYFQGGSNGWASITGTSAVKANVPAGKYAYATFTLKFLNGNVVDASDTVQPYDKLSLRVETQNAAGAGTVYDGAKFAVVPVELSLGAIGNATNTAAFTSKMLLDDLSDYQLAKKEITNGNAEAGVTSNWAAFASGGGTLSTAEGANGTATSIKFVPNNTAYASIAYDLGPAIVQDAIAGYDGGGTGYYRVSFYAKAESGKGGTFSPMINSQAHVGAKSNVNGYETTYNTWLNGSPAVTMTDEWQKFTFEINLYQIYLDNIYAIYDAGTAKVYELILRLDGSNGAFKTERFTYFIDEVTIEKFTPTAAPTATPTVAPTATPTVAPTATPTVAPTATPTVAPTATPTVAPTATPTVAPTATPTVAPTATPTATPTVAPTATPTVAPTATPTVAPTATPTVAPTATPTVAPTATPTVAPTATPTVAPTATPTVAPTATPTAAPAGVKIITGTNMTDETKKFQVISKSGYLNDVAKTNGTITKTYTVYNTSSVPLQIAVSLQAATTKNADSSATWACPTSAQSKTETILAGGYKEFTISLDVVNGEVAIPNCATKTLASFFLRFDILGAVSGDTIVYTDADAPKGITTQTGTASTTATVEYVASLPEKVEVTPTAAPTATPTVAPTATPTVAPTATPTVAPTATPTVAPTATPTVAPTATPTVAPTATPTVAPTATPTVAPTATPTVAPTATPTVAPTATPTVAPTATPAPTATVAPTATPCNHKYGEWKVTKEATATEEGTREATCEFCKEKITQQIGKLTSKAISEENTQYAGMTKAPKLAPANGTTLPENVVFKAAQVEVNNLPAETKTAVNKAVENVEKNAAKLLGDNVEVSKVDVLCVLDLDLLIDGQEYNFDGTVTVTIDKPAAMKDAKNPCFIHIKDDGTVEVVKIKDNGDGTVSFDATGFSKYVLVDMQTAEKTAKPNTGDSTMLVVWGALLLTSSAVVTVAVAKRKKEQE